MSQGDLVVDDFQLVNCIASGNASQVWEVTQKTDNQQFAMKLLLPESMKDVELLKTLKHEGKVGKLLDHANIIKFHKVVVTKEHAYILMDYFRAPNVKAQIGSDIVGLQSRIRKLIEGLCLSVGYMHEQGWLHRDLKPDNVLFSKGAELRLLDFSLSSKLATGIAKMFAGKVKVIQGTRTYIAPETIRKEHPSPQTDMYSLGVTLYEVLTGQPPYRGSTPNDLLRKHLGASIPMPSHINANVTPEMDRFIARMLAKKPKDRHKSMDEVYAEFRSLKVFKEDVLELAGKREKELAEKNAETFDGNRARLSSRADAERGETPAAKPATAAPAASGQGSGTAPTTATTPPAAAPARPAAAAPAVATAAQNMPRPGQPAPGMPMPVGAPGMPQPRPGYPQPGMMPPPGYPAPAGMPQGYPPAGYPSPNPGAAPNARPMPMPGQMPMPAGMPRPMPAAAPGGPPAGQPLAGAPGSGARQFPPGAPMRMAPQPGAPAAGGPPRPAAAVPPAQKAPPAKPAEPEEIPMMEELPPIL